MFWVCLALKVGLGSSIFILFIHPYSTVIQKLFLFKIRIEGKERERERKLSKSDNICNVNLMVVSFLFDGSFGRSLLNPISFGLFWFSIQTLFWFKCIWHIRVVTGKTMQSTAFVNIKVSSVRVSLISIHCRYLNVSIR